MTEKIKRIYETVPVYRDLLGKVQLLDNFRGLPLISRDCMINGQSGCIAPEYCSKYIKAELIRHHTSGSTGKYLNIFWDKADYNWSMAEIWMKRYKYYGIFPHSRFCYFFTENMTDGMYIRQKNELGICKNLLNPSGLTEAYEELLEWNPQWMLIQPSTAVILCGYIKQKRLNTPEALKYIEFTGEILTEEIIKMTREVFGCSIANQYGANEVNAIAYTCPEGRMHIMRSNVFVEIVDDDGRVLCDSSETEEGLSETGRVVLTSLSNNAMPFVRYDIGDRGRILKYIKCGCGCKGDVFELESGRSNDYVYFKDGNRTSPYVFVRTLDRVNNLTDGAVLQFYIEQRAYDRFDIKLYIDEEVEAGYVEDCFICCLDEPHLMNAKFDFEFSESIFDVKGNGKYIYFKNLIEN